MTQTEGIDLKRADDWLRAFVFDVENPPGAPGLDIVDSEGRKYNLTCRAPKCRSRMRHSTNAGTYVCGKCGEPWGYRDVHVLKGAVQQSRRPSATEAFMVNQIRDGHPAYRHLYDAFTDLNVDPGVHWEWRVYVAVVLRRATLGDLASPQADRVLPGISALGVKKTALHRRYHAGRAAWGARLRAAGLL